MSQIRIIYTIFKNSEEAHTITKNLLEKKLIACANTFPAINSSYIWNEKLEISKETPALLKTNDENIDKVIREIEATHSYDVPCIISIKVEKCNALYEKWVASQLN
jgi:periplasmic divalent cation tolerance protein